MRRLPATARHAREVSFRAVALLFALIGTSAAWGQQQTARGRISARDSGEFPRLPGAVSKPPTWLGTDAPFDVAKFFAAPPRNRNAAPLYLDALFEFSPAVAECFAPGPERERRRKAAMNRSKRFGKLMQPFYSKADTEVPPEVVEEVIRLFDEGFRKLREAQRRDQCVFESGLGVDAVVPHLEVARHISRIASPRVHYFVQRGELEAAIRDVDTVLRLARDIQRRGGIMTQLVASAVTSIVGFYMVPAILSSPKLKPKDCDSLIKVLSTHDQKSMDGYAEGLRANYVDGRATLRDFVLHQRDLAARLKLRPGESVVRTLFKNQNGGRDVGDVIPADVDARLAQTTPAKLAGREREINRFYRTLLSFDGVPAAGVFTRIRAVKNIAGPDILSLVSAALAVPGLDSFVGQIARARAILRGNLCLVAMRRWQIAHRESIRSLSLVVKDTALKSIPIDPYDGKPLRLLTSGRDMVIYSVGGDGKDDGGQTESKYGTQPGDVLFRLPAIEKRHRIRPL